ncbi:VOC family protein [Lolliginicoccus lacisalsi]|uniref:VOC family protein n=1 Tax=Lolliginicoccus lacisalsi TaxID=2742202 RepID=UPI001CDC0E9C|nr:VOC family protein [Lolliginicoccus lacisalsi]
MTALDRYIPGVPCWADTSQPDPDAAAEFYGGLFGWQCEDAMPPGAPSKYLIGRLAGGDVAAIMSSGDEPCSPTWNTYVWVESADVTAGRVTEAGGTVAFGPSDVPGQGGWQYAPTARARASWSGRRTRIVVLPW